MKLFFSVLFVCFFAFVPPASAQGQPYLVRQLDFFISERPHGENTLKLFEILKNSLTSYETLNDYRAIFYKTEKSKEGRMGDREEIYLKFEKPFKIFMKWMNTHKKDLQVFYERGKYDGKLVVHKPGLVLGLLPVIFLDPNSPWVREGSASHNIEDAGIGNFLHHFTKAVIAAENTHKLRTYPLERVTKEGLSGQRFEVVFEGTKKNDIFFAHRIVVTFDETHHLPIGMDLYDWENKPIGMYEYRNIKIDVAKDPDFKNQIDRSLYKIYTAS